MRRYFNVFFCHSKRFFASKSPINSTGHSYHNHVSSNAPRILVTGASGQIGTELVPFLRKKYGVENVIASDLKAVSKHGEGPFYYADVTNFDQLAKNFKKKQYFTHHIKQMVTKKKVSGGKQRNMAVGEQQPKLAIKVNNQGVENILELAKMHNLRIMIPSTIAAFGPTTPQDNTPNLTIMRPTTIYGWVFFLLFCITKVYNELLGEYYHRRYNVDFRSLRYPGIISSRSMPGGGTTDYAVWIYHQALKEGRYECFLSENTLLPMMFMDDCLNATLQIMEADNKKLRFPFFFDQNLCTSCVDPFFLLRKKTG
ncbi:threonine dehydrogenase [Reticulomyxa filosa]|uniref:Threonine dehydrogenase n=1 Tax=Reticulomyxa filosa TaxID=46433 RepID=X6NN28_RETFI|nr:threonine dehydrogenase [Reticulomyxa filosa]|eukprot:ETO27343.1 threonine dehydrogenase [Reticulomyxa filosa]